MSLFSLFFSAFPVTIFWTLIYIYDPIGINVTISLGDLYRVFAGFGLGHEKEN
jgi:hypothetical protein